MNKLLFSIFTFISFCGSAQQKAVINDANAQKRTITAGFSGITVSDGIDLYLTQSNEASVAVSAAEEKYLERFKTEVENGILKIYYDSKGINWKQGKKKNLKAYVSFRALNKLNASGGSEIEIIGSMQVKEIEIKCTSGARMEGKIDATDVVVDQNSGSTIELNGNCNKVKVEVSSGAVFKGFDLVTDYCDAKATSGGGIRITIIKELEAKANTGGGIKYRGDGVIKNVNVNSGGTVKKG
jgi:hypothetical protein